VRNKPDALVLDFFAGSGTTVHALNLLNLRDGGNRRSILVTNNEVSADDATAFGALGLGPGDEDWESHGVCRSITWPKFSISGHRDDNTILDDVLPSGRFKEVQRARSVKRLSFVTYDALSTLGKKKELVGMLGKNKCPQSAVQKNAPYVLAKGYPATILFDESKSSEWIEAISELDDIHEYYVVSSSKKSFDQIRQNLDQHLGPRIEMEVEMLPMSAGFPSNMEYFRLDFLDKNQVELGRQFRELLPLLWLRAGAVGPRPVVHKLMDIPAMLIPEKNPFAVLNDESNYTNFQEAIKKRIDLTHVFLVTDSEDSFHEMAADISVPHVVQLYRDYLENFMINKGELG
jgi:adenine-specific DNA-methyltransferase